MQESPGEFQRAHHRSQRTSFGPDSRPIGRANEASRSLRDRRWLVVTAARDDQEEHHEAERAERVSSRRIHFCFGTAVNPGPHLRSDGKRSTTTRSLPLPRRSAFSYPTSARAMPAAALAATTHRTFARKRHKATKLAAA